MMNLYNLMKDSNQTGRVIDIKGYMKVFYHSPCVDGLVSAAIFSMALEDSVCYSATYVGVNYDTGDKVIEEKVEDGDTVFFLDFCPSIAVLEMLSHKVDMQYILDHHESSFEKLERMGEVPNTCFYLTKERSGAGIAYDLLLDEKKFYLSNRHMTNIVNHVSDYDTWQRRLPDTEAFHAYAMATYDTILSVIHDFKALQDTTFQDLLNEGKIILRTRESIAKKAIIDSVILLNIRMLIKGTVVKQKAFLVNIPHELSSMVPDLILDKYGSPETEPPIILCYRVAGDYIQYSARTQKGSRITALDIARRFQGGGHENAAGFRVRIGNSHIHSYVLGTWRL
jgi:oligoribonuclease NrnB/cAMP/cGMP phosphodiesterase (DHH superfamily)